MAAHYRKGVFRNHSTTTPQSFHNHFADCRIPGNLHSVVGWPAGWLAGSTWPGSASLAWLAWSGWLAGWPTPAGWLPVPGRLARLAGSIPQSFHNLSTIIPQSFHNRSTIIPQQFHNHSTIIPQSSRIIPQSFHRLQNRRRSAFCGWLAAAVARPGLGRLARPGWLGLADSLAGRPQLAGCPCLAGWLGWPDPFHNHSTTIPQSFHNHSTITPQSFHNHSTIIPQSFHRLQNPKKSAFCGWLASWLAGGGWLARLGLGRLAWPGWLRWLADPS